MNKRLIISGILFLATMLCSKAQEYAAWDKRSLTLDNGIVKRRILINSDNHGIVSNSLKLTGSSEEFINNNSEEFSFEIDGRSFTGSDNWNLVSIERVSGENDGKGAAVILERSDPAIKIEITYLLYPGLPVIRKKIEFQNAGSKEMKLESIDIECIRFQGSNSGTDCWVMHDYARQKSLGQFVGDWYDPVVIVHEVNNRRGIVLGNEAPGVMKRTTAFLKPDLLTTGLTHSDQNFGFRKWLKPGEKWESTWVFTGLYSSSEDPYAALNGFVSDYVRNFMGIRLSKISRKPVFVYNTWIPFTHNINEKLIYELADATAECGVQEFVIDDGWQTSYGDWGIDTKKFPNGLKPVFDYIKSKGMKPGLWISIAAAESVSNVYKQHPEWVIRNSDGKPTNIHSDNNKFYNWESYSMCMTTGWFDYIKGIILKLVKEHGLEYLKADFAVATGAYTTDKTRSGCSSTDHPMHRDRNESLLPMYQRTWQLFDDLHQEASRLFIDCTFETMGALQLIDLDMCKHAEGNWLSNFGKEAPMGSLRVRQMSWWRTPSIPATALVIGNQQFDDPNFELSLMSLAGSLPIVLGDPRLLTKEQRARMKTWSNWLINMEDKHDFMSFRQDLQGFGEPAEGLWDGFQRINSETHSGGIVGVFRQASEEEQRKITVKNLDPSVSYDVFHAPDGQKIVSASGKDLAEKGFLVKFSKSYDGALYEICKTK